MVETQDELKIGIGDEEVIMLKPANVKILNVRVEEVGKITKAKKVICEVKHPDSEIPINISGVKCENKGKLEVIGLWVNKDSKGFIRKGSTLALFLNLDIKFSG